MKSNMLNRPVGIDRMSSRTNRVSSPLPRASMREPAPSTVSDSADPRQRQHRRSLDGGAGTDTDVVLVIAGKASHLDVERVRPRRQRRKPHPTFFVGCHPDLSADQCG
jgi:hypothetical protein